MNPTIYDPAVLKSGLTWYASSNDATTLLYSVTLAGIDDADRPIRLRIDRREAVAFAARIMELAGVRHAVEA